MRKKELAQVVAKATDLPVKDCLKAVDMTFRMILAVTERGEPVEITGFGAFERRVRRLKRFNLNGGGTLPPLEKLAFKPSRKHFRRLEEDDTQETA